jgi:hypothetical protein
MSAIVYCRCAYAQVIPAAVKDEVLARLSASGAAFEAVPDLCALSAHKDPSLRRIAAQGDLRIAACFPRAVRWLFHGAGAPLSESGVEVLNMRSESAERVADRALRASDTEVPA